MKKIAKRATPHYDVFICLMRKFNDNWSGDTTYADGLTREEMALLNGYKANTGDVEIGVYQTLGLNSAQFDSRLSTHRLAQYCMMLDAHIPPDDG